MPNPATLNHSKGGQPHITHGCITLETAVIKRYKRFQKDMRHVDQNIALSDGTSMKWIVSLYFHSDLRLYFVVF